MTHDLAIISWIYQQNHMQQRKKTGKLDFVKIKNLCISENTINKRTITKIKIFANNICDMGLYK